MSLCCWSEYGESLFVVSLCVVSVCQGSLFG